MLSFLLSGQALAGKLVIKSNPEDSTVYVVRANGKEVKVGKTPFEGDLSNLTSRYVKSDSFVITLKKKGYEDYRVLMAKNSNVDMNLSANLTIHEKVSSIKEYDLLIADLFDVQRLMRSKNYSDAQGKLDSLEKKYNGFSIIPELKGIAYYMSKDIEKSLSHFRRAFSVNPENKDAYKMKVYLEKKLGVGSEKL